MKNTLTRADFSIGLAYAKSTVDTVDARHAADGVLTMISATQIPTIRVIRLCLFTAIVFVGPVTSYLFLVPINSLYISSTFGTAKF